MRMRMGLWWGVALVAVLASAAGAAGPSASAGGPSAEELIYQGSPVEVQVDVNGQAAVELLGGVLDGAEAALQAQAKAAGEGKAALPPQVAGMLPVGVEMLKPAKEAIKSITQVTFVVMKPKGALDPERVREHYANLMRARGWVPLASVRGQGAPAIQVMLGPGGKGLFGMVFEHSELVVALIATNRPLGEVLGEVVRVAGGNVPAALMAARMGAAGAVAHTPPAVPAQAAATPAE